MGEIKKTWLFGIKFVALPLILITALFVFSKNKQNLVIVICYFKKK
jgi:hypothetical protein